MKKAVFTLEMPTCPTCVQQIESTLETIEGIKGVIVLFYSERVRIQFDPEIVQTTEIKETIEKLGYPVLSERVNEFHNKVL